MLQTTMSYSSRRIVHRRTLGIDYLDGGHGHPTLCHFSLYLLDMDIIYESYESSKYTITISVWDI